MTSRLCGEPLRTIMWETCYCARPAGHKGSRHRSAAAMKAARQRAAGQPPSGSLLVAAVIREARERVAMSRPCLAVAVGVTATAVMLWEQGKRTPNGENWVQLELALGPLGVVREAAPEAAREDERAVA